MSSPAYPLRSASAELPALHQLITEYAPSVTRPRLVLITHILPTARQYIDLLATVFDLFIVAIPYSCCPVTVERLKSDGYTIIVPDGIEDVASAALKTIAELSREGRPIVVQEVGGYLAAFAETLNECENFRGVVEDTNNGHWRYAKTGKSLEFPVLSIARSPIKAIEDSQIGDAVVHSIERIMREQLHRVTKGINALVLGFGKIGSSCADALRRRAMHTAVFDSDPVKLVSARAIGHKVDSLKRLLGEADLVVGATGHCSLKSSSLGYLKDGAILASASSRQIEFDVQSLQKALDYERVAPDVERYLGSNGRHVYLFSEGYPVNFRDYSVLGDVLDAVYSELFLCVRELFEGRASVGLSDSWSSIHAEVAEAWCECHLHLNERHKDRSKVLRTEAANTTPPRVHHNGNDTRIQFPRHYPPRRKSKIAKSVQTACKMKEVKHA